MDVVVTVPKSFGLDRWIGEGDPVGKPWSGVEWDFYLGNIRPNIQPGERVYVVYNGALRGYAPLVRLDRAQAAHRYGISYSLVRHGNAVAVTIPEYIKGFQGFRYRWWDREIEVPFPNWHDPNACIGFTRAPQVTPRRRRRQQQPATTFAALMREGLRRWEDGQFDDLES